MGLRGIRGKNLTADPPSPDYGGQVTQITRIRRPEVGNQNSKTEGNEGNEGFCCPVTEESLFSSLSSVEEFLGIEQKETKAAKFKNLCFLRYLLLRLFWELNKREGSEVSRVFVSFVIFC